MDDTQWYAIGLGGLVALSITFSLILCINKKARIYMSHFFRKHLFYPQIHRYLRGLGKTTRFDMVLIAAFLIGNVICVTINVKDIPSLIRRSSLVSIVNLMPLSLGARMNLVASRCGISLGAYASIHRWLGWVAVIEGLVHATVAASHQKLDLQIVSGVAALTATIAMGTILLSSVAVVRRYLYEIFLKLHQVLAAIIIAAIYLHSPSKKLFAPPIVYLFAAICLRMFIDILRFGQILYRNVSYGKPLARATVQTITYKRRTKDRVADIPLTDAVHVHLPLSRSWKPQAGQYVYLYIPGVNRTSFIQSHPFFISWWYRDAEGNNVVVFIVEKRGGFTRHLQGHAKNKLDKAPGMRAIIEGPYGKELDLRSYGTVLLFATGIGITGQLPYVTRLLEGYHNCEIKTRRIALFWQLDSELHAAWVADMMKELLKRDTKRILDIQLFILGDYLSSQTKQGDVAPLGKRIKTTYEAMNAEKLIRSEIKDRKGHTVVSLCANDEISDKIREIVRHMLDKTIHLKELEYRPYSPRRSKGDVTGMVSRGRGEDSVGSV